MCSGACCGELNTLAAPSLTEDDAMGARRNCIIGHPLTTHSLSVVVVVCVSFFAASCEHGHHSTVSQLRSLTSQKF